MVSMVFASRYFLYVSIYFFSFSFVTFGFLLRLAYVEIGFCGFLVFKLRKIEIEKNKCLIIKIVTRIRERD